VDACRGGWVAVVLGDGRLAAVCVRATLAEMVTACPGARRSGWTCRWAWCRAGGGRPLAGAGTVPADDILDAAAAGWTAARIARGQASSLPHPPQPGEAGQPIAIWY
jgi:predicted RNase H-like nuclease